MRARRFYKSIDEARREAKKRRLAIILVMTHPRQYYIGRDVKKAMQSFRESTAYLGKAPPKLIADYR